ncbi:MAG: tRNA pseudouridine(38-40) synthase TruA [Candidatus Caldatribacteriota bacterium]|nr:tRNA pseudouridine(38-40) synthase TruA [Candidatus Caldatribacteriota bacterium]
MINIKLTIEYDGTEYYGWQRQKKLLSIQKTLEEKISQITNEDIKITGSGRTDAGVHAIGQVANFKMVSTVPFEKLPFILNNILPIDIRIKKSEKVNSDFHARHSSISKIYHYYIFNSSKSECYPSLHLRKYVYCLKEKIDLIEMKKASRLLLGKHDFHSFSCSGSSFNNSIRTIKKINLRKNGNIICFQIEATAFLYKMVRRIAGTLLEVGKGSMKYHEVKNILENKDRKKAGKVLPAKGLFLMQVKY